MAFLVNLNTDTRCFVSAHHRFGRLDYAVDTVLSGATISKHHAVIEWQNNRWQIRDVSRNGTWVNHTKLEQNTPVLLSSGDEIYFAAPEYGVFLVVDLSAPCDLLIPINTSSTCGASVNEPLRLDQYHFLPDEDNPQWVIFKGADQKQWFAERIDWQNQAPMAFNENDTIEFTGLCWQLKLNHQAQTTELLSTTQLNLDQLNFVFDLSQDEEKTCLRVQTVTDIIDFSVRSHHYLMLSLARYRAVDALAGMNSQQQGWVTSEKLMKDSGLDYSHLNILIHRARKQLADALDIHNVQSFIERHEGKLRFGASQFKIIKGQTLECELPSSTSMGH